MTDLDIETIRLPLERDMAALLDRDPEFRRIRARLPPVDAKDLRRRLAGAALMLSEKMAPEVHEVAHEALHLLGMDKKVEIYQSSGFDAAGINAAIHFDPTTILIHIEGRLLTNLDRDGKLAVFGHELAHYLSHGPDSGLRDVLRIARQMAVFGGPPHLDRAAMSLSMSTELTADRVGLLVCQDLDAMLRVEMVHASGLPTSELSWDPQAYLAQARELMEQSLTAGENALGDSHPEHSLRAYATWLFSETDLYRELTGQGPGSRSLRQVNTTLHKLVRPAADFWAGRTATPTPPPGPTPRRRGYSGRPQPRGFTGKSGQPVIRADSREDEGEGNQVLTGVSRSVDRASKAIKPGISKVKQATADHVSRVLGRPKPSSTSRSHDPDLDDVPDPLADDEQDLLDRFAELERKMKDKS